LHKVHTELAVPQKTLSKLSDRIENASTSIVVDATRAYKKILLIDDAVGSGATLNETARMLRERGIATGHVYGLSIVGSLNGFDVISEV
jgi:predicted amidophosphoribosyltransferase